MKHTKNTLLRNIFTVTLTVILSLCMMFPFLPVNAETVSVATASELNEALGGGHSVKGAKLTLQKDIVLDDRAVRIIDASNSIVLDMNGHSVTTTTSRPGFVIKNARLVIQGNGTFTSTDAQGIGFRIDGGGKLRIDNGTFDFGGGTYTDETFSDRGTAIKAGIADGETPAIITINGGTFRNTAVKGGRSTVVNLTINGGDLGDISLGYPQYVTRIYHKITINGGSVKRIGALKMKDGEVLPEKTRGYLYLKGGTVKGDVDSDYAIISAGTVEGRLTGGIVKIFGGTLKNSVRADKFAMNAGVLYAGEYEAALTIGGKGQQTATFSGGKIYAKGTDQIGILCTMKARLNIKGGYIIGNGSGKAGIYMECVNGVMDMPALAFRSEKRKDGTYSSAVIKGFKYGLYRTTESKESSPAVVKEYTRIIAKGLGNRSFYHGALSLGYIEGDIVVKHTTRWR